MAVDRIVAAARAEAAGLTNEAARVRAEREGYLLRERQRLHEVYGELRPFVRAGRNDVNQNGLEGFLVAGDRIQTYLYNTSAVPARPSFRLTFLTAEGFVTGTFEKRWLWDRVAPGQKRVDDDAGIEFRAGQPAYYTVRFK